MSLHYEFVMDESIKMQLRTEFFFVFAHFERNFVIY